VTEARGREATPVRVEVGFGIGLFVVALVLRLYAAGTLAGEPVWDGHYYDFGARHIASGFGYADEVMRDGHPVWHPWCHYPVGYSGFLAAFYMLFGTGHAVAHFANALVGALLALVTYLLAREALSPRRAMVAGALVAFHPGLVLYGALLMTEPLSALLVLGAFYVALRVARSGRPFAGIAAGALVMGLAALVRPQALLCAPFLVAALPRAGAGVATRARDVWRQRALGLAVACGVALVPVLPWTARNCRVMDGCALVSTNAGWNLAIGSFPRATGRFETLRSDDGCREVTGQVQQDRCWLEYGLANIKRAPGRWLALVPAKLAFTFDHESFAVEYLREARPAAWPEERRVAVRGLLTSVHRIFVAASALGFVALALRGDKRARRVQVALLAALAVASYAAFAAGTPTFWPIVLVACLLPWLPLPGRPQAHPALLMSVSLVATTALAHAIFFGEDRYHMVATPVLCLLAAAALRAPAPLHRHVAEDAGEHDDEQGAESERPPVEQAAPLDS
jgi:4-amino-4-deoxy-L-arabinose transferase-like glycosyltransferase